MPNDITLTPRKIAVEDLNIGAAPGETFETTVMGSGPATLHKVDLVALGLPGLVSQETPAGAANGINLTYTLSRAPYAFLVLFRSGLYMRPGTDYTLADNVISVAPAKVLTGADWLAAFMI